MPSVLNLKFKGNKSYAAFSNLSDADALTKTWKACTKVASYLEQGERLERLSWRLWHMQNLMVDADNAKPKREFKKLSKCMNPDKEKGRRIEELKSPDSNRHPSVEIIRQRPPEKERLKPDAIKRMQLTYDMDQPAPASMITNVKKANPKRQDSHPLSTSRSTVRTQAPTPTTRSSDPGATATSHNPAVLRGSSDPGGVKPECFNCGAIHTPLWRRGLNDELNCNACGLYCKLHKRPRPKSLRNSHGEGRTQAAPRRDTVDAIAQCYNCQTTVTPFWRKDEEGKTFCNACGIYYKLHGSARPTSMKLDVIHKRSRHDARRKNRIENTPSTSPGASRRTSLVPENNQPTLAPDTSTAPTTCELIHALGTHDLSGTNIFTNSFSHRSPGTYYPDHLVQTFPTTRDRPPLSHIPHSELMVSPRNTKRQRTDDSASQPSSSAVSYASRHGRTHRPYRYSVGSFLSVTGLVEVQVDRKELETYDLRFTNNSDRDLHPYVSYFENCDLRVEYRSQFCIQASLKLGDLVHTTYLNHNTKKPTRTTKRTTT